MGNTVVFAIRDDKLRNLDQLSFDALTSGLSNGSGVTRFIGVESAAGARYSNVIAGVAVSHYSHYDEQPVIYIDNNILHSSAILQGLDSDYMSPDDVISHVKRTSKYMLGTDPFSVTRQIKPRISAVNSSSESKVYVFGFKTDDLHDINDDPQAVRNILSSISNNDLSVLKRLIKPIAVIPDGKAILVKMHKGAFFTKPLAAPLEMEELLVAKNGGETRVHHHDLAFSIDFLNSLGYSLRPMSKLERDDEGYAP